MPAAFVDVGLSDSNNGSVASKTCDAINLVAGNAVIVFTRYEDNDTTVTITDTAGNTYTELTTTHIQQGATGGRYTAHYCLDCLGHSTNVITMTLGANKGYVRVTTEQWSGVESLVDHETASAAGASVTGAGLTATEAGVLIAGMGSYNARVHSLAGNLVNSRGRDLAFSQLDADGDVIVTGAGTYTGAFTSASSTSYALISILFSSVAGGPTLTVQDCTHSVAVDNVTLTQANTLVVADALHSVVADNTTLSFSINLIVSDATHSVAVDNVVLTQANILTIQNALHSVALDNVVITQANTLVVADALHSNIVDNILLSIPSSAITPLERVFLIPGEDRTFIIASEDRIFLVESEDRVFKIVR